ncbi:hypothetical protein M433DRAFT_74954 [Acidomyces richmondensis BFW]|nr:hypothetical protein M433DRAFT_74954 [Acidomyces richmondensis BFW]
MPPSAVERRPRVLLFDIGGVCVVSPFQAILDYEKRLGIPPGWVNYSISATNPHGAWQQLERGEVPLDDNWFKAFKKDLSDEDRWRIFYTRFLNRASDKNCAAEEATHNIPPIPDIDAEALYWGMMRIARTPDPHMYPALKKLRAAADESAGGLILGALSNTSIFPPGHPFNDTTTPEGKENAELKALFDVFISSAHVGMRKPDEEIYRYAITRLHEFVKTKWGGEGISAKDITFLDDIGSNLRTARKLGMRTIKVELGRADKAVMELEKLTGLSLTDEKARL